MELSLSDYHEIDNPNKHENFRKLGLSDQTNAILMKGTLSVDMENFFTAVYECSPVQLNASSKSPETE
jgi:hypothetical protein